jgi:flagellum-specific ATP synthase
MHQHPFLARIRTTDPVQRHGRVRSILPTAIEADGPTVPLGTLCEIDTHDGQAKLLAEVVRVDRDRIILAPLSDASATFSGAQVVATQELRDVPVGDELLGRALNAFGQPIDGKPLHVVRRHSLRSKSIGPFERVSPKSVMETGIRAIDGLLTLGQGQRIGVFAASGVGKTSLMSQLAAGVGADRCVICLIGERGREVESLWNEGLPEEARQRSVLIAATSDEGAAIRVRSGHYALAIADHWRSQGHQVLLLMDSVTRLAMAMREMGLAAGEPPTLRAYTPSVFAAIPKMVEQCGAIRSGGSITAILTILAETDDVDDPIAEVMKSILDGHIILSRQMAEQGHFPAIDVVRSVSRRAEELMDADHRTAAARARTLLSHYEASRTLIEAGLYNAGNNADVDAAIAVRKPMMAFLQQSTNERISIKQSCRMLHDIVSKAA